MTTRPTSTTGSSPSGAMTAAAASELFRQAPDGYIDVGVGEAAYRKVGTGPDVLFVHGWPVSGATFRTLLPFLVDHVTCHVIDLPSSGSSRFEADAAITVDTHIAALRTIVDELGLDDFAVVGHDSGGMVSRHAFAGDPRVRSMGLIATEQSQGLGFRFRSFISMRNLPKFGQILGWMAGQRRLRRNKFAFGDVFLDSSLIDGEFDEFFLQPLHTDPAVLQTSMSLLRSLSPDYITELESLHAKIDVPVKLVWGAEDRFFPVKWAREMVATFPNASIDVIDDAGLFVHEERPAEAAASLLKVLLP